MEASKHMEQALATAGEMITVWYPGRKANECVPFRAKVKKASHKHGMHIDLIDLSEDDPHKEDWLDSESSNWLIGDWHSYSSKDEASQERSNQKADAATVRLRQGIVRSKGATALAWVMRKQERAREFTIEREANLFRLAEYGSVSDMEAALREGIRLDTLDVAYRRTATMVAAGSNSADVLRAILKATEDPKNELRITSPGGFTALHWAAMNNSGERGALVVKQLLLWNADASLQNTVGDAALDLAVRFGNQEVAAVLNRL